MSSPPAARERRSSSRSACTAPRGSGSGRDVFLEAGGWLQALDDEQGEIHLGDGVRSSGLLHITALRRVTVEDHVLFGRNVAILDHHHAREDPDVPVGLQGVTGAAEVRIGAGSWLGTNVVVMPGVTIGRNAVVGSGAVVTRDVPARAVVAGVPARSLR